MELPSSSTLMISAAVREQLLRVLDAPGAISPSGSPLPLISGITATPVSKPDSPSASFGKTQQRGEQHHHRAAVLREQRVPPPRDVLRVLQHLDQRPADDDDVQHQVDADDADGKADRLLEALQEDRRQQREQHERHPELDGGTPRGRTDCR